jgi:hypothetical protein
MPLLEAIEQRATALGVSVDARIIRGRTYRDALRRLLDSEHVDRVIVSATSNSRVGLRSDDLEWLLEKVRAEVTIPRPDPETVARSPPTNSPDTSEQATVSFTKSLRRGAGSVRSPRGLQREQLGQVKARPSRVVARRCACGRSSGG